MPYTPNDLLVLDAWMRAHDHLQTGGTQMPPETAQPVDAPIEATVIKRGETCVQVTLHRDHKGLMVQVKAHKAVEDFMRTASNGEVQRVDAAGRGWRELAGEKPLEFYHFTKPATERDGFTLGNIGKPLVETDASLPVNLSFLRLRGISEGAGVRFTIPGVFGADIARATRDRIATAARRFYQDYLRPMDLTVTVSTQEIQL